MKKLRGWVVWLLFNPVLMGVLVYYGVFGGVQGAGNLLSFMCWVGLVSTVLIHCVIATHEPTRKRLLARPVPPALDMLTELALLGVLVWHGWFWSAGAWVANIWLWSAALPRARMHELRSLDPVALDAAVDAVERATRASMAARN